MMAKKLKLPKSNKRLKWNLFGNENFGEQNLLFSNHIEIIGNKKIEIEGCEGVYEYTSDYLKLRLKKGAIVICGKDFDIESFENKFITVKGDIKSIEFCV